MVETIFRALDGEIFESYDEALTYESNSSKIKLDNDGNTILKLLNKFPFLLKDIMSGKYYLIYSKEDYKKSCVSILKDLNDEDGFLFIGFTLSEIKNNPNLAIGFLHSNGLITVIDVENY